MVLKAEFDAGPDCIIFTTQTNSDRIRIGPVHLDAANAAELARLININQTVHIVIKEVAAQESAPQEIVP